MSEGVPAMLMRGGTSKGLYFLPSDLPKDPEARDAFLLSVMGSPDPRQIDGIGGATSVTSKVAVVQPSSRTGVDVDYLFLQVGVDQPRVTDMQNCGNILAGVGPFAIERGLVAAAETVTKVRIFMANTGQVATAEVHTPGGKVSYAGEATIDGVPGHHAAIPIYFDDLAGSTCGALFPTGAAVTDLGGIPATLIDNGMPCVVLKATDLGVTGYETPEDLDSNSALKKRIEEIRLTSGELMRLGDVSAATVPKMVLVAPAIRGGTIHTRCFIPHICHRTLGLFAGVSIATACLTRTSHIAGISTIPDGNEKHLLIEHPSGALSVNAHMEDDRISSVGVVRTARKLFDGQVFPRP